LNRFFIETIVLTKTRIIFCVTKETIVFLTKRYQHFINTPRMSTTLNTAEFSRMIKSKRGSKGLRILAQEISISPSTLSRIEQGNLPDIDTYLRLCNWLEVSSEYFLEKNKDDELKSQSGVIAHLRADQTLPSETAEALIQMINLAYESATKKGQVPTRL